MIKYIIKIFFALSFLLLISITDSVLADSYLLSKGTNQSKLSLDEEFKASLKENTTIGFFNRYWIPINNKEADGYYRKLIKIEGDNLFLVQDFFTDSDRKQSDPVLINNIYELKRIGFLKSIVGAYVTWYQNGQKQFDSFYNEAGVLEGAIHGWYSDGTLKLNGFYENGQQSGNWTEWHQNGKKKLQVTYDAGVFDGVYAKWYENGQQQIIGAYRNGLLNGLWIVWNSKGNKVSEGEYVDNRRERVWSFYSSFGKWAEGDYVNDSQDGKWIYWDNDGKKFKEILYRKGTKINERYF